VSKQVGEGVISMIKPDRQTGIEGDENATKKKNLEAAHFVTLWIQKFELLRTFLTFQEEAGMVLKMS